MRCNSSPVSWYDYHETSGILSCTFARKGGLKYLSQQKLYRVGDTGPEPFAISSNNSNNLHDLPSERAAECGAVAAKDLGEHVTADPDLKRVIEFWPTLSTPVRTAILALVQTGQNELKTSPSG
jgi:hypothetical protein